ncbi:ribbon-helix-helix domain-containing protein [Prochlorococcus sp. MIT 1341]|uniref:ribbon-helix-helix domain-containing protein n=1 Tax=Prochlorococcus sp. MIT 1341 TaxID=3096221 RepID=UPI002A763C4E|nr:CopG family transcriptional regulator [Prochlorococcus sp. MIT 1341]
MSLIQELIEELQKQQKSLHKTYSTSEVAEAAESERLNLTLPVGIMNKLKYHAIKEKRSCSSLASFLIEDGIRRHKYLN